MQSYGILDSTILFAHFSNPTQNDAKLLLESNSHASSTPSTEMQMAMGHPVAFDPALNIQFNCSLGVDCHTNNSASMVSEMRLLLQSSRAVHNQKFIDQEKLPTTVNKTVEEAFNLGTIGGARAINMQDKIGSLAVGKLADIVVFDTLSPSMVCGAEHDPVAAIVLHSSPADIEMVIVDGIIRKHKSVLKPVDLAAGKELWSSAEADMTKKWEWREIARELNRKRMGIQEKIDRVDVKLARQSLIKALYVDESKIVESL
jgi:cytosine/adenosine deaminase-related metal-dependent hydrolase